MPNIKNANISSIQNTEQGSTPDTPDAGFSRIFSKDDGFYIVNDSGEVTKHIVNTPTTTAQNTIQSANDIVPLTIKAHASQTEHIAEFQDDAGGAQFLLDKDGYFGFSEQPAAPTAETDVGKIWTQSDNSLRFQDGDGNNHVIHGFPAFKSETVTTQGLGANPDVYAFGYYEFSTTDANLNQGSTTVAFGDANVAHDGHAFVVCGGAGSVDTGVVGLRVTGTSITDAGVRTTSDSETIIADITTVSLNDYVEGKKWLGIITFELFIVSGSPTTYSLDINYGLSAYEDFANNDFTIINILAMGLGGASDNDFDVKLVFHNSSNWVYAATGFSAVQSANVIASLVGDQGVDDKIASNKHFRWKRTGLTQFVSGASAEGFLVLISSSANNAIEYCNIHVGIEV